MHLKPLLSVLALSAVLGIGTLSAQTPSSEFRRALEMYDAGMYEEAGALFREFSARYGDPLAEGYSVLSSAKLATPGYESLVDEYAWNHPSSAVLPEILFTHAENLFDEGRYEDAESVLETISFVDLKPSEVTRYRFKKAYSSWSAGHYATSEEALKKLAEGDSEYRRASAYAYAYILYGRQDFENAFKYFGDAAEDVKFAPLSRFYRTECRFMQKDYRYVVDEGVEDFPSVPDSLKGRMARLISESYLILGDADEAVRYYDAQAGSVASEKDADRFYAGSVRYAAKDWEGAIREYSAMKDRADSLWQIAASHIGYSNIQLGNKVAALDAFKSAASLDFDKALREDTFYNWAKLSFDINNDPAPFEAFMAEYPAQEKSDQIYGYIALAALLDHDYEAAIEAYDNIDELSPKDRRNYVKANYLRGNQLISAGSWRSAAPYLKAAAHFAGDEDPLSGLSLYWHGQSLYMDDKFSDATEVFKGLYNTLALGDGPEGARLPYDIAYSEFRQKKWSEAAKWFDRYLKGGKNLPGYKDAAVRRADCDFYAKDYKKAVSAYDAILSEYPDPNDVYVYYQDAIAYGLLGKRDRKLALLENVLKADSGSHLYGEAMYELGSVYVESGADTKAINVFKTLHATAKDDDIAAKALLRLGMTSSEQSRGEEAINYYKRVVSEYPGTEYAEAALGSLQSIYTSLGEGHKYLDYLESLSGKETAPDESEKEERYFAAAEQAYLSANYSKAITALEDFKARYPGSAFTSRADYDIAQCYRQMGRGDQALDYYSRSIEEAGEGEDALPAMRHYASLAYSLERYGDSFGAWSAIFDAVQTAEESHEAALGMMRSAFRSRNYADAVMAADEVLSAETDDTVIREARYVKAKSCLASSRRDEAVAILKVLAEDPMTEEGAEAGYILIQDCYDRGSYAEIGDRVQKFSGTGTPHVYWLARALIVLGDTYAAQGNPVQARYVYEGIARNYEGDDDVTSLTTMRLRKLDSQR